MKRALLYEVLFFYFRNSDIRLFSGIINFVWVFEVYLDSK